MSEEATSWPDNTGNFFILNPFSTNATLLYPLKTSENQKFANIFRWYRSETLVENGLIFV